MSGQRGRYYEQCFLVIGWRCSIGLWRLLPMTVLLDNKLNRTVGDALMKRAAWGGRLSMLSNSFSIYAFMSLKQCLNKLSRVRILLPLPNGPSSLSPDMHPSASFIAPPVATIETDFSVFNLQGDV